MSDLRILAGESEELLREAKPLNPFQRGNILGSILHDKASGGDGTRHNQNLISGAG